MIFPDENPTPPQPTAPAPPPADGPSRNPARPLLAVAVLTVALAAFGGAALSHVLWPPSPSSSSALNNNGNSIFGGGFTQLPNQNGSFGVPSSGTSSTSAAAASVAKKIDPGLVDINTEDGASAAAGTGMVVSSDGEVITNNHVIKGASTISATDLGNGQTYTARVVGYDRQHDVAVLMLEGASGLATVPLGNSAKVHIGASVLTFGNAGGVGGTPSVAGGSVSALGRAIIASDPYESDSERLSGLIQIAGQIQPGDSGGPLTSAGKVVGMDTAASTAFNFQSATGAGYAIPINSVITISDMILHGDATSSIHIGATAIIGVYVATNNAPDLKYWGCPSSEASESGVLIAGAAVAGSPAASLGLARCNLITSVGGIKVGSPDALLNVMETYHPGDSVALGWLDNSGGSHTVTIRLGIGTPD